MKRIVVSVISDLVSDQRVDKICTTLHNNDYDILLFGRASNNKLDKRAYKTKRIRMLFKKGFLMYAEFNTKLFFKLLFTKKGTFVANDLDTLLPNFLVSKLFGQKLVYDSHELFTEVPELIHRPHVQKIWLGIENYIFPKLKNVYTVNQHIANIYSEKYGVNVNVIRNIAPKLVNKAIDTNLAKTVKGDNKMLILQGAGINVDRGAEEAVAMMQYLDNCILYIIGSGDVFDSLPVKISELNLENKVFLKGRLPYNELMEYTKIADIGLSLDKGTNLNYEYSLPNKVFDYIQAEIPLLVSNRKIVANLVEREQIGVVSNTHNPKELAQTVKKMLENSAQLATFETNLKRCSETYSWENQEQALLNIYSNLK